MVNIEWETAYNGDEVILIGSPSTPDGDPSGNEPSTQGVEAISCEDLAQWAGTIPYEILTNINTRVSRIYR
jgi:alanine racemase